MAPHTLNIFFEERYLEKGIFADSQRKKRNDFLFTSQKFQNKLKKKRKCLRATP
jgi:hypothetical protein